MTLPDTHLTLAHKVAGHFARLPQVEAVALGGSFVSGVADDVSDIDVYVYTADEIPVNARLDVVKSLGGAAKASMDMTFWGYDDSWVDRKTGVEVDVVYLRTTWLEAQLERVIIQHEPSGGYTTSFWRTVRHSQILSDPEGWFTKLQTWSRRDYPETLRRNIVTFNHAALRNLAPSYRNVLAKSVKRGDIVSVHSHTEYFFKSYFDIIFALNRVLHPGEKRLLAFARRCERLPLNMEADVRAVLRASSLADETLIKRIDTLMDRLDDLLVLEGFDPDASRPTAIEGK